jgi:glycosyltransferase involved in cell wall biosynthesis
VNELVQLLRELKSKKIISEDSVILFVDDGSFDNTWSILKKYSEIYDELHALKFSKNFGHQGALLAGYHYFNGKVDCVISIDADLQQDINAIPNFIDKYNEGYEIIYGIRNSRDTDSFSKKFTALIYYRLMKIMGVNLISNHADYRLVGKKALISLSNYTETNLFLRGLFPEIGYKSTEVFFDVKERQGGQSKYTFKKMINLAINGITSFTVVPLKLISFIGFMSFLLSIIMIIYAIYSKIVFNTFPGWASTTIAIYFIGGVQLISLGVVGEYIGKIYMEIKRRPIYLVEDEI